MSLLCPACDGPMATPMQLACAHNVCVDCADTMVLAELTNCGLCGLPMGVPVPNVALAAYVLEDSDAQQSPQKRVRRCATVAPNTFLEGLAAEFGTHALAVKESITQLAVAATEQEAAFEKAIAAKHEQLDAYARSALATFRAAVALAEKQHGVAETSAEIHAAQLRAAALYEADAALVYTPRKLPVLVLTARLEAAPIRVKLSGGRPAYIAHCFWKQRSWQTPPLAASPPEIIKFLLLKQWGVADAPRPVLMTLYAALLRLVEKLLPANAVSFKLPCVVNYEAPRNAVSIGYGKYIVKRVGLEEVVNVALENNKFIRTTRVYGNMEAVQNLADWGRHAASM